jgi:uncharacterized protein YggE
MNKQLSRLVAPVLGTALLVGSVFVTNAAGWLTIPEAHAQMTQVSVAAPGTITVVGEGKVSLEPDIARVSIGVETVKNSVQEASAENRTVVEAVLAVLQEQGVAEEDIQTSGFTIYSERYGPEGPLAEGDVRYRVSNNVMVTIRQLENVGTILDAAIEAGANNIYGVEFLVDEPGESETEARTMAVEDAHTKAAEIAELNGLELGNVISVSEVIGMGGGYYAGNFAEQARMMGGGGAPIAPGQLDMVMQLQIVFAIGEGAAE